MLGKQRNKQVTDSQFMDAAWKNMAEILDQEMPVEKKEQRIGWLAIAAMLVVGFVGGIAVTWGLQIGQSAPMALQENIPTPPSEMAAATPVREKKYVKEFDRSTDYNHKISKESSNVKTAIGSKTSKAAIVLSNSQNIKSTPNNNAFVAGYDNQRVSEKYSDEINTAKSLSPIKVVSAVATNTIMTDNFEKEMLATTTTAAELSPLGLSTLSSKDTDLKINSVMNLPKDKKWRTGIYAGAIIAGRTGNGAEVSWRAERKLSSKWSVETGLGLRSTYLFALGKEEPWNQERDLTSLTGGDDEQDEYRSIADELNSPDYQITVPIALLFRPTGKLRLAMGMGWAYRLNKLKEIEFQSANGFSLQQRDTDNKNSFKGRLGSFRLNMGVGYSISPRTGMELTYNGNPWHEYYDTNGASGIQSYSGTTPLSFFQIGLMHYFGG